MEPEEEHLGKDRFLELQYNTLRKEIETRQDRHFKLATGAVLLVPAVQLLSAGLKEIDTSGVANITFPLLLALPIIVLSIFILYFSEHHSIMRCGRYIEEQIEAAVRPKVTGWESWLKKVPRIHEAQQIVAFHLFYVSLYIIAVAAVVIEMAGWMKMSIWIAALTGVIYAIVGVLVILYAWIAYRHKGAEIKEDDKDLIVHLQGLDKLCAFRSSLKIPKGKVLDAEAAPDARLKEWKGFIHFSSPHKVSTGDTKDRWLQKLLMHLGISVPGVFVAGISSEKINSTESKCRFCTFWNVYDPAKAIKIKLEGWYYDCLVIEAEDPDAALKTIQAITERQN